MPRKRKANSQPKETAAKPEVASPTTLRIVALTEQEGNCPFEQWFNGLRDRAAWARIVNRFLRAEQSGNLGDHRERIAGAISEMRIDYGPGYRVYFVLHGATLIVLLGGGTKSDQQTDITAAVALWERNKDDAERFSENHRGGPT